MLSNIIIRSAAAFGGAPFRLSKRTALGSFGANVVLRLRQECLATAFSHVALSNDLRRLLAKSMVIDLRM